MTVPEKYKKLTLVMTLALLPLLTYCGKSDPLYIGVVGPMTGKGKGYGRSMRQAMILLTEELNAQGGINERPVELIIKDDQNNKKLSPGKAAEFAADPERKPSVVIGHYYSSTSLAAQDVYRKAQIPTITPSATNVNVTRKSKWMFRSTFDDQFQGKFLGHYAKKMLKARSVIVIHDEDAFGNGLKNFFMEAAKNTGLRTTAVHTFNNNNPDYSFVDKLNSTPGDLIFLAVHAPEAITLVKLLRKAGTKKQILGPDAMGSQSFIKGVGPDGEGIFATTPLLFDIAGETAQVFYQAYVKRFGEEPDWQAAYTYDAGLVAAQALREAGPKGADVRTYLSKFTESARALQGVTGANFFDEFGNMLKPPAISRLTKGKFISTLTQLKTSDVALSGADIRQGQKEGRLIMVDKTPFFKTHVVYTGIDIIDLLAFEEKDSTFTVDFYLWFRWRGKIDPTNFEFADGVVLEKQKLRSKKIGYLNYTAYRIKARFGANLQLKNYPFDKQTLRINFRHKTLSRNTLLYVADVMNLSPKTPRFASSSWQVSQARQYSDVKRSETTLGDPEFFGGGARTIAYATYNYAMDMERHSSAYLLKLLFPLLLVIVVCFVQFHINPKALDVRAGIGVTGLLTAIAFHCKIRSKPATDSGANQPVNPL